MDSQSEKCAPPPPGSPPAFEPSAGTAHADALPRDASPAFDDQLLAKVFESAPHGVVLSSADGRILLANAELERMFGHSRAALQTLGLDDLVPDRFRDGHALLRRDSRGDLRPRTMGAGRELVGRRADGTEFPIEVGISSLLTPDGTLVVETIIDISVRKRLERVFQRTVEAAPCGMVMVDSRGRIMLVNPQAESMFGYARAELIGNGVELLLPERLRGAHQAHRRSFAGAPSIRSMGEGRDLAVRRKDGSEFPVEIGLSPVAGDADGLVLAAVTDISRHTKLQRELRQANADLEEFTYAASHDLKAPLQAIGELVQWIAEDLGGNAPSQVAHNLARIGERTRRLERVIDDLLKYAKAGKTGSGIETVDPRELLDGALQVLDVPPEFEITVHAAAQPFSAARTPLETVLRNIVGNAVKHHDRAAGRIDVRIVERDEYCVFTVSDDGPGIPAASRERVFRMFQTLAAADRGNSGVGLALSKRLAEAHGGRIELGAAAGGRGAAFQVWWPRHQGSPP